MNPTSTELLATLFFAAAVVHTFCVKRFAHWARRCSPPIRSALWPTASARRVLVGGYVLGILTAVVTTLAFALSLASFVLIGAIFVLAGLCMAVQEALEATITADLVSVEPGALSYGVLGTVNGLTKFVSSTAVGLLWTAFSPELGF